MSIRSKIAAREKSITPAIIAGRDSLFLRAWK
jgi:hypothetical protein